MASLAWCAGLALFKLMAALWMFVLERQQILAGRRVFYLLEICPICYQQRDRFCEAITLCLAESFVVFGMDVRASVSSRLSIFVWLYSAARRSALFSSAFIHRTSSGFMYFFVFRIYVYFVSDICAYLVQQSDGFCVAIVHFPDKYFVLRITIICKVQQYLTIAVQSFIAALVEKLIFIVVSLSKSIIAPGDSS
jgi:hypothetical protein